MARVTTVDGCWVTTIATAEPAPTVIDSVLLMVLRLDGALTA